MELGLTVKIVLMTKQNPPDSIKLKSYQIFDVIDQFHIIWAF